MSNKSSFINKLRAPLPPERSQKIMDTLPDLLKSEIEISSSLKCDFVLLHY